VKSHWIGLLVVLSVGVAVSACDSESGSSESTTAARPESSTPPRSESTTERTDAAVAPVDDGGSVAPNDTSDGDGANPLGGNSPEDRLMPDVVCMNLQDAQDEIQDHGVFFSGSVDATGQGRNQVIDSNWVVVDQSPTPGSPIGEGDAELSVVKYGETTDC
jgi:beta-lactam-binding protein with PASTA domain